MNDDYLVEPFETLLENLVDEQAPIRAALIYRLSRPDEAELAALNAIWSDVPTERKRLVMARLVETSEVSIEVDYSAVAEIGLNDEDAHVRVHSIKTLWEDLRLSTMNTMIQLLRVDSDSTVRAAAARALGRFVLAGELEDISRQQTIKAEEALLQTLSESNEPIEVHRRALESIAYASRDEVAELIEEAHQHRDLKMKASAIFAMGRSADDRWEQVVFDALHHEEAELQYEAARAAGELLMEDAIPILVRMMRGDDPEIKQSAIWALGEIGGATAQNALMQQADKETNQYMLNVIEDALNVAALSTGEFTTYILSMNEDPDEPLTGFNGEDLDI